MKENIIKKKGLFFFLLIAVIALTAFATAACSDPVIQPGAESGLYYYEAGGIESTIKLHNGNKFDFAESNITKTGTYTLEGKILTLTFKSKSDTAIVATFGDRVITVGTKRYLEKIEYTVTFDSKDGSAVAPVKLWNGQTVQEPARPALQGFYFVGWYTDNGIYKNKFNFGKQTVVKDITLYAYWVAASSSETEFIVGLNLNYQGAPAITPVETIDRRLYDLPEPMRAEFEFGGWWFSFYADGSKLAYPAAVGVEIEEPTELYALWLSTQNIQPKLTAPVARVEGNSVAWDAVSGAASYRVQIEGPAGSALNSIDKTVYTLSEPVAFSSSPSGEYKIKVTAQASEAVNNSDANERYFINKKLARVSEFKVTEPSVLIFNEIKNATKYLVTVNCGDSSHAHTDLDIGDEPIYDFSECHMIPDGIAFTVKAAADGWITSVSESFYYERKLAEVTGFSVDPATQVLSWVSAPNAESYAVSIVCADDTHSHTNKDNGNKTTYPLKECAYGSVQITVKARAFGYNDSTETYTYNKTNLAAPRGITVEDGTVKWIESDGADLYAIKIGTHDYTSDTNSFVLTDWSWMLPDTDYELKITAKDTTGVIPDSLWSDIVIVRNSMSQLTYAENYVRWASVISASEYEVTVNGEKTADISGATRAKVILTQAGTNTITVRAFSAGVYSAPVSIEVFAYTLTFDSCGGEDVLPQYYLKDDKITLDNATKTGYTFDGWYTEETGGIKQKTGAVFAGADVTFYAHWTVKKITASYHYADERTTTGTVEIDYDSDNFKLEVPVKEKADGKALNDGTVFVGWYTLQGERITDESGNALVVWQYAENKDIYALWGNVLKYMPVKNPEDQKSEWAVSKGKDINKVSNLIIPAEYNGLPVSVIEGLAFYNCYDLKGITIPESIRLVEATAFDGCTKLADITVNSANKQYKAQDGVLFETVRDSNLYIISTGLVFYSATKQNAYIIPGGVTDIYPNVFANRLGLTEITIPSSVTAIGAYAFNNCVNLTKVNFLTGTSDDIYFGDGVFKNCTGLTSITLPTRVTNIPTGIFTGCNALTHVNIYGGASDSYRSNDGILLSADGAVLLFCPAGRTTYTIPDGVTTVGASAFAGNKKLTKVVIAGSVTLIENSAFFNCSSLDTVEFLSGSSDLVIGNINNASAALAVFGYCSALKSITLPDRIKTIGGYAFYSCGNLKTAAFDYKSRLTAIGASAFNFCYNLTGTTLPDGLLSVGASAFGYCYSLKAIEIPGSVNSIGNSAFTNCRSLITVGFAKGASLSLGTNVFQNCGALTTMFIPENMTSIGTGIFAGCNGLTTITVDSKNTKYTTDDKGVLYEMNAQKELTTLIYYPLGKSGEYTIPSGVTAIGASAFQGHQGLTKITIPGSVTTIGIAAFASCGSLADIVFLSGTDPLTITSGTSSSTLAAKGAFAECTSLNSIELPVRTATIGNYAFYGCYALTDVTIPNTVKDSSSTVTGIGNYAFQNCKSLTGITFTSGGTGDLSIGASTGSAFNGCINLDTIQIPARVTTISASAFSGCSGLREVTFESGSRLSAINNSAFSNCVSLTSIDLAAAVSLKTFGTNVFSGCSVLASAYIPKTVATIGAATPANIFSNCVSLQSITVHGENTSFGSDTNGVLYSKNASGALTSLITYPAGRGGEYEIASSATSVGIDAFRYSAKITGLTVGENIESFGNNALADCPALSNVDFTNNTVKLATFGVGVFSNCSSIQHIVLPGSVTAMGNGLFNNCSGLLDLNIPKGVTTVSDTIFNGCAKLENIYVDNGNANYDDIDGVLFAKDTVNNALTLLRYPQGRTGTYTVAGGSTAISLSTEVTSIAANAFYGSKLTGLTIPGTVTSLGANYTFRDSSLTSITIPGSIQTLSGYAFYNCTALTTVVLENGIETIGGNAFQNCTALRSVTIPSSVTAIGNAAFDACGNLESITLPAALETIGYNAFRNCAKLENIVIPGNVSSIDTNAFQGCTGLLSVTVNGSIETIAEYTFDGCKNLAEVSIPTTVKSIGQYAFRGCVQLSSITIHSGIMSIGQYAFQGAGLTELILPIGLETVGAYAFADCADLQSITIPGGVKTIGQYAFQNCVSLTEVFIPGSVTTIGSLTSSIPNYENAFTGCANITVIALSSANNDFVTVDGIMFNAAKTTIIAYPAAKTETAYSIPNGVTAIGPGAFAGAKNLREVIIANGVITIGANAFNGCIGLDGITIPAGVISIGANAFQNCVGFTEITIPNNITSLGAGAFSGCVNLSDITLSSNITSIGAGTFQNCGELQSVDIPSGVTSIGANAFQNCVNLSEIIIPDTVTSLGNFVFAGCGELKQITLPAYLTNLGENAFENCANLSGKITIPNCMSTIYTYTFAGCEKLSEIVIPASITLIGAYAFKGCTSLTSIDSLGNIQIINIGVFQGCTALESIKFPARLAYIYAYAFDGCISLDTLTMPVNSLLLSIGTYAFNNCTSLTSITIASSVITVEAYAFNGWTDEQTINIQRTLASKPVGWDKDWYEGCAANPVWLEA